MPEAGICPNGVALVSTVYLPFSMFARSIGTVGAMFLSTELLAVRFTLAAGAESTCPPAPNGAMPNLSTAPPYPPPVDPYTTALPDIF